MGNYCVGLLICFIVPVCVNVMPFDSSWFASGYMFTVQLVNKLLCSHNTFGYSQRGLSDASVGATRVGWTLTL